MKKNFLICVISLLGIMGCIEDDEIETVDSKIYFSGITMTDEQGNLLSELDTTDWRFDDNWTTQEENLFSVTYTSSSQKCEAEILLYPNPFQDIFWINLNNLPSSSRLALRLVNKDFEIIFKNDSINSSVIIMPEEISGYDTLRLYYKLIDSLNYEFKGHGDILIKD